MEYELSATSQPWDTGPDMFSDLIENPKNTIVQCLPRCWHWRILLANPTFWGWCSMEVYPGALSTAIPRSPMPERYMVQISAPRSKFVVFSESHSGSRKLTIPCSWRAYLSEMHHDASQKGIYKILAFQHGIVKNREPESLSENASNLLRGADIWTRYRSCIGLRGIAVDSAPGYTSMLHQPQKDGFASNILQCQHRDRHCTIVLFGFSIKSENMSGPVSQGCEVVESSYSTNR